MESKAFNTFWAESEAVTRLSNILCRFLLPLFAASSGGKPKLVGSSFLVSSGTSCYLVSAAHVFDELRAGRELFFYVEPKTTRKLSGTLWLTRAATGMTRACDRLDVGVLKLEGPGLPPYPKVQKHLLPISALMANALPRDGKQYLLVGFPESKSRANPVARYMASRPHSFRNVSRKSYRSKLQCETIVRAEEGNPRISQTARNEWLTALVAA